MSQPRSLRRFPYLWLLRIDLPGMKIEDSWTEVAAVDPTDRPFRPHVGKQAKEATTAAADISTMCEVGAGGRFSSTASANCPGAPADTLSRMMSRNTCFILNPLCFLSGNNRRANKLRVVRSTKDSKGKVTCRYYFRVNCRSKTQPHFVFGLCQ